MIKVLKRGKLEIKGQVLHVRHANIEEGVSFRTKHHVDNYSLTSDGHLYLHFTDSGFLAMRNDLYRNGLYETVLVSGPVNFTRYVNQERFDEILEMVKESAIPSRGF